MTARTRGVIIVHPNNPTGHFTKPHELEQLNEICSLRDLAIIADEVFLDFALQERRAIHFRAEFRDFLTFTMSGLSKISGLPQMKAAWLITSGTKQLHVGSPAAPGNHRGHVSFDERPIQRAIPALLDQRHPFQTQLSARVREQIWLSWIRNWRCRNPAPGLVVEAGWYAVLRVPATRSDEDLAIELLTQKNVYVHPGHFYDFSSEGFLIVSLITRRRGICGRNEIAVLDVLATAKN